LRIVPLDHDLIYPQVRVAVDDIALLDNPLSCWCHLATLGVIRISVSLKQKSCCFSPEGDAIT
jgi:hypothetical protein